MTETHKYVDPYPAARQTMNEACNAMIKASEVLHQADLTQQQRKELAAMVAGRAKEFGEMAAGISKA